MASMATTWSAVSSIGSPTRGADRADDGRPDRPRRRPASSGISGGRVADALPSSRDHAQLEREQLVERETAQGGVPPGERRREVRLLDGPGDRHQALVGRDLRRQVFRVGIAGLVERLADGGPQADGGQARRQRVDRHDPAGVEQLGLAGLTGEHLELRVVEGQPAPEVLDLAGHDDLGADREPALDEPPPEPRRVDRARVVLEPGDGPLRPAAEPRLDADVADRGPRGHHFAVAGPDEIAERAHLAQVVVAPGQMEEEVADRVEVELDAGPAQQPAGRQARSRERGRQQGDRVGRCRRRARRLGHAYSAEIRYR